MLNGRGRHSALNAELALASGGVQRCLVRSSSPRPRDEAKPRNPARGQAALIVSFACALSLTGTSSGAEAGVRSSWQGTILCTTSVPGGYRSFVVDGGGQLARLTLGRALSAGLRVQVNHASKSLDGRSLSVHPLAAMHVLGRTRGPLRVRRRLIESGYSHYRFYRNGRPWGCPVAFDDAAAPSVAKLILSGRPAQVTLALRDGQLVHLGPRQPPIAAPAKETKARAEVERLLALLGRGKSIAACTRLSTDALLIHGGTGGCLIAFESAKFMYRDRYMHASVEDVALFDLDGRSYALATIKRPRGYARAILIHERRTYRYLGDLDLSPIELW
jgi:hypothetical protein